MSIVNARPSKSSAGRRNALAVVAVALAGSIVGEAAANDYLGGIWNSPSSWSDGQVPDQYSDSSFLDNHTGTVQIGNGATTQNLNFKGNATGYELIGNPTAILTVRNISNENAPNTISTTFIRGLADDSTTSNLDINLGTNYFGVLDRLTINSVILDALNPDDANSNVATNLFANGTFTNQIYTSGAAKFFGATRLTGSLGRVVTSNNITLSRGTILLDNSEGRNTDRLKNGATVHLDSAELIIKGDGGSTINELIQGLTIDAGSSGLAMRDNATLSLGNSPTGMTRSTSLRGTIHLNGEDHLKLTPGGVVSGLVPYAVIKADVGYHLPVKYDKGPDNATGTADDGGLEPVTTTPFANASTTSEALVQGSVTATSPKTINSLTINNGNLNLGINTITVNSGVVVIDGVTSGQPVLSGSANLAAGSGSEMIIFNHVSYGQETEFAGHIGGGNGLTISTFDDSEYLASGNKVKLSGSNSYSGQTTINGGDLTIANAQAIPSNSALRLVDCNVNFDYAPSGAFTSRIILDGDAPAPHGARDNFLRDIRIQNTRTLTVSGSIEGHGAYFLKGDNVTLAVTTPIGTAALNAGEFSIWPQDTSTLKIAGQLGDANLSPGTVIQLSSTAATTGNGRITGGVQLSAGTLSPGSNGATGTGTLRMRDLSLYEGDVHFNVNGTTRGTSYDALDVDTNLYTNGGGKIVIEAGGVTGQLGQRFELMRYQSFYSFGTARPTLVNPLPSAAGTHWVQIWGADKYELAVAGPLGDANLDGRVNFDDLVPLAQNYNMDGKSYLEADFTNDGRVNFDDLVILAQHYNEKLPGLLSDAGSFEADWALAQSLVPEPTTLMTGVVAALGLSRRRR